MELGEELFKVLLEEKNKQSNQEDISIALDFVFHELINYERPSLSRLVSAYSTVFESALYYEEWDIVWHCLKYGYLDPNVVVDALSSEFPMDTQKRSKLVESWADFMLECGHHTLLFDILFLIDDSYISAEKWLGYVIGTLKKMKPEYIPLRFTYTLYGKLIDYKCAESVDKIITVLVERKIDPLLILKCMSVSVPAEVFEKNRLSHAVLKECFQDEANQLEVFKKCIASSNYDLIEAYEKEINSEAKATELLIAACRSGIEESVYFMILRFIKNRWAIDEKCLEIAPSFASTILQRGLRIKGGTLNKLKQHPGVSKEILRSLLEGANPKEDEVSELRLKALLDPEGKYQFEYSDEIIVLAKDLKKEHIISISKDQTDTAEQGE